MAKSKSRFLKTLAKRELLAPHLDAWFASGNFPDDITFTLTPNKEKDEHLHPSMHALACPRFIYAQKMDHLPPETKAALAQTNKMFFTGDFMHKLIQWIVVEQLGFSTWNDIEKEHLLRSDETPDGNRWTCRGFVDIANCHIPEVGNRLVDIKTANARVFATGIPPALWEKYVAQVSLYLDWEDKDEEAIILLCEKDHPHRYKELYIQRDDKLNLEIYDRWDEAIDAVAASEPPECWCDDPSDCPVVSLYAPQTKIR